MKLTHLLAAALIALGGASANAATSTTIDFESFAPGTVIGGLDINGVEFRANMAVVEVTGSNPGGTGNAIQTDPFVSTPFSARLSMAGVRSVSVDMGDFQIPGTISDEDTLFLKAFDAADNEIALARDTLARGVGGMLTLTVSSLVDIAKVKFGSTGSPDGFPNSVYADNFSYTTETTPIPLPAGFVLLGTAIAGLGFVARRRKTA